MTSIVQKLNKQNKITPPKFVPESIQYETMMGSFVYGVSNDTSDVDVYGFCIPKKEIIFPHISGHIPGFGTKPEVFEQYQQHHIKGDDGKQYDLSIYNIVKYFQLCMDNNPNMIDSLFTRNNHVTSITKIGQMVKENRHMFLHKGAWYKFKGYAYSQLNKIRNKNPEGKRKETIEKYGYDVKFAYHVVRLLDECEQILSYGDIDLMRNNEHLKAIRRGDISLKEIEDHFSRKEVILEKLYHDSKLQYSPNEEEIQQLLLDCLEEFYGSIDECITIDDKPLKALKDIQSIIDKTLKG